LARRYRAPRSSRTFGLAGGFTLDAMFITLLGGATVRGKGLDAGLGIAIFLPSGSTRRMLAFTPILGRLWNAGS
jgi:hypothetical protein